MIERRNCPMCSRNDKTSTILRQVTSLKESRIRYCIRCDIYFSFHRDPILHHDIPIEIPKEEVATVRFQRTIRLEKLMDAKPVTFGQIGSYYCRMCRFPFHAGKNVNKKIGEKGLTTLKLASMRVHYKGLHPKPLPFIESVYGNKPLPEPELVP